MLFLSALALPCAGLASPITYTLTATGTGTLGASSFTNAAITFTQVSDTNTVVSYNFDKIFTNSGSVLVTISGLGGTTLGTSVEFLLQTNDPSAGNGTYGVYDPSTGAFFGIQGAAWQAFQLATAMSPTGGMTNLNSLTSPLTGTAGNLKFSSFTGGTGSATLGPLAVTPEPSTLTLLGTGVIGALALARRRFGTLRG